MEVKERVIKEFGKNQDALRSTYSGYRGAFSQSGSFESKEGPLPHTGRSAYTHTWNHACSKHSHQHGRKHPSSGNGEGHPTASLLITPFLRRPLTISGFSLEREYIYLPDEKTLSLSSTESRDNNPSYFPPEKYPAYNEYLLICYLNWKICFSVS